MDEQVKQQKNDLYGHYTSSGGPQLNGVIIKTEKGDINIGHANPDDQASLYKQCLRDLRATDPRIDKRRIEGGKDRLLKGSCSWVVDNNAFQSWWEHDDPHLLWIHGDPGKGKTMMMFSLYSEVSNRIKATGSEAVVSYFFCQSTDPRLNHAVAILRGLIFLLVAQDKQTLLPHLRQKLDETEDPEGSPNLLYALFQMLIDLSIKSKFSKVYLLIDALDECNSELSPLLREITISESNSDKIKWLVTSRNETIIKEGLSSYERPCLDLELNSTHVSRAVDMFIHAKVTKLVQAKRYDSDLTAEVEKYLSDRANGTFLWVAFVCKELESVPKLDTLNRLGKFPTGLGPLYERILAQLSDQDNEDRHLQILRLITLALRPLHLKEIVVLGDLLPNRTHDLQDSQDLVDLCGSFLTVRDNIIYFVHQSATDFFKTGKGSRIFPRGESHAHICIATRSLELMTTTLQRNICGLPTPDSSPPDINQDDLEQHLPLYIQYSVQYWLDHLHRSQTLTKKWCDENARVLNFFQSLFLNWLEALSLMKIITDAVHILSNLYLVTSLNPTDDLSILVSDARLFLLYNRSIIERAPLQVYSSAIVFSPQGSVIRKYFLNQGPGWISKWPVGADGWTGCLSTLEGHILPIHTVAFSPNGQLIASASDDKTTRLWDTQTGALQSTLRGHLGLIRAVAFSPNSTIIASASYDTTIRIWDTQTGALQNILKGHLGPIFAVAFSPNGQLIASASDDKTMRLWDAQTGVFRSTLEGHLTPILAVAFSPDGRLVASASDKTVRLWDTQTSALQSEFKIEDHLTSQRIAIAFSPNGQLIASAAGVLELWDVKTGTLRSKPWSNSEWVHAFAFSPNGQLIASPGGHGDLELWDVQTGTLRSKLKGHTLSIYAVAFSPNGQLVASASDTTVLIWNVQTGALQSTLIGHTNKICAIVFSPNGKLIASASEDKAVRLWDTQRSIFQTLEGHLRPIRAVAFSPNGQLVASASYDTTVRIWDAQTGAPRITFGGHLRSVCFIAFSPNSQLVASASDGKEGLKFQHGRFVCYANTEYIVQLWDVQTGAIQHTLEGHTDWVRVITFSPNGQLIASASDDNTARLWDVQTGTLRSTLKGHFCPISIIAFSPNNQLVASASGRGGPWRTYYDGLWWTIPRDKTVRLWDTRTGALLSALEGHPLLIRDIAFSPNSQLVASASEDRIVRIWNTQTGAIQIKLKGHSCSVNAVLFLPNSQLIASASDDKTVRLWDVQTGTLRNILNAYKCISNLSFITNGLYIISNRGRIDLEIPTNNTIPTAHDSLDYSLSEDNCWIVWKEYNVLWLPPEYRPICSSFQECTLLIGHSSGRITLTTFQPCKYISQFC